MVGPEGGDAVDIGEFLAALFKAGAEFIAAVRFEGAGPKGPRFAGGSGGEEVVEVGGVVVFADLGGGGFLFAGVEGFTGELAGLAFEVFGDAGAPALAGVADGPAVFGEGLAPALEFDWEKTEVVGGFLELPGIAAGEDGGAGRGALGVGRVGVLKQNAVTGDAVEGGRLDPRRAISAGVRAPVVGDDEEDVGWSRGRGGRGRRGSRGESGERKKEGEREGEKERGGERERDHGGAGAGWIHDGRYREGRRRRWVNGGDGTSPGTQRLEADRRIDRTNVGPTGRVEGRAERVAEGVALGGGGAGLRVVGCRGHERNQRGVVTAVAAWRVPSSAAVRARLKTATPPIQPVKPTPRLLWITRPMVKGPPVPSLAGV